MSFYTNNIKKRTEYQQDSTVRNHSQKQLDRKFQSQLPEIQKFQSELKASVSSIKRIKQQQNSECTKIKQIPTHSEVIEKLLVHCQNPTKKTKSLSMLLKLFSSKESKQVKGWELVNWGERLIKLKIETGSESVNCCKMVSEILQEFSRLQGSTEKQEEMIKQLVQFWGILRVVSQDDSFDFYSTINHFQEIIKNFQINKPELDTYEDSLSIKTETTQATDPKEGQQPNKDDKQQPITDIHRDYQKRQLIILVIKRLLDLDISWKKLFIDQFMKNFNNQQKNRILHPNQIKQFQDLHKEYINKRTKNNQDKEQQSIRDQIIDRNNVVQINAEVKQTNGQGSSLQGNEKWISKQN